MTLSLRIHKWEEPNRWLGSDIFVINLQLKKKIENKLAQAMAERTRLEILARQKLEERKTKAKTLAEERIAAAKARASAIRTGAVKAELISTRRRFSMRW